MRVKITAEHAQGFKTWLGWIGYCRKDLPDGGSSFKNSKMQPRYLLISNQLTASGGCRKLYREYKEHLAAPDGE